MPRKPACPSLVWNTSGRRATGDPGVGPQRADAADTEKQLLAQPVLGGAAVETIGHVDVVVGVPLDVGVEHQQRHPTHAGHPDARDEVRTSWHRDADRGAAAVGLPEQGDRQLVGVEHRVGLLLPSGCVERLLEVAVPVEQPDPDDRHAEVAGALEVVAGQDAEPAGVLGEHGGDAELRGEVGDGRRTVGTLALVPAVVGQVALEVGACGGEPRAEPGVAASASKRSRGTEPSSATGSKPESAHRSGSISAKTSCVGGCHDQRRLPATSVSAASSTGRTGRTVKRRKARTERTLAPMSGSFQVNGDLHVSGG